MMVSDEEKRWLVVGIAMNKVAAPVLRDFIKQGMDTHYANNTYCHGLTTPCTLNTLTYHHVDADSNLRRLKFQNVNSNLNNHGNHKKLYNYNINSSVDLPKLFLPDYLAEFSGFDESLDMSAIFRLLGCNNPAPIFHSPNPLISIQLSADDVRENVRNKWGHCNVTEWTEIFFNDCFSKLETLVRSLGLTGGMEKTTLDELCDWQTKGCQLCMGHAVDQSLLSVVQQDVRELIKNYKKSETEQSAIQESLAQQRIEQTEIQNTVTSIQDQQSSASVKLQEHNEELAAVWEWKEQQIKESKEIMVKLVSVEKMLSEEILLKVEGVEKRLAETDDKVEQLERGFAKTDDEMEQLERGFAKTDDKVVQLERGFAKTDGKVEQLERGFAKTDDKVEQLEQGFAKTDDKVEQLERGFAETDDKVERLERGFAKTDDKVEQLEQGVAKTDDKVEQLERGFTKTDGRMEQLVQGFAKVKKEVSETGNKVEQLEQAVRSQRMKENKPETSATETFDVESCRNKLAEHYKRTATVPTSVWSKSSPVDIHQIYTRLSWVKEEQTPVGSSQLKLAHYTDVFTANKKGVVPKRILVQGQTGIGKSTFVKKLAVDWAELDDDTTGDKKKDVLRRFEDGGDVHVGEDKEVRLQDYEDAARSRDKYEDMSENQKNSLKKFELVLAINLKEASKCHSLREVVRCCSIFPEEESALVDGLVSYITKNQEKVLMVFDGYDEYRCGSDSEIYEIFKGKKLRNCCVLITTRISKADELREFKDVHAEITGFSEEDRVDFMIKVLGGKAEAEELRSHLSRKKLTDLTRVPLLLLFFCALWKKGKLKSFPETKTKLYLGIVQYVLDYNQGKDSPAHFGKVDEFREILAEIGKVALECLLKDDHVFEYDQLSAAILCDESLIIGLLQVTEYAENLRPAGMVSFIHKSIQEFLAAWYITYRCVPDGNLGEIEQHARTMEECEAVENVFQFICGLSDDGAVKVLEHLKSVRISDPSLDLSKIIPDVENETDVPLSDVIERHERFSNLAYDSFQEVDSKAELLSHCFDCNGGIFLDTKERPLPDLIPKADELSKLGHSRGAQVIFTFSSMDILSRESILYKLLKFLDCMHALTSITESWNVLPDQDFVRKLQNIFPSPETFFKSILCFRSGQCQIYITGVQLHCDAHAKLFTESAEDFFPLLSTNLYSEQSCLKFLTSLRCWCGLSGQTWKALGAAIKGCKHLKRVQVHECDDSVCDLLEHVRNPSKCSLGIGSLFKHSEEWNNPKCHLTPAGAVKFASLLPRFNNIIILCLDASNCCSATVDTLVASITHKTLVKLELSGISLTPAAAAALGRSFPEMSSLQVLELTGVDGSILEAAEIEALFGGFNKTLPLYKLTLRRFSVRGCLSPLAKSLPFFPSLRELKLEKLNIDEHDQCSLLESLGFIPNLKEVTLQSKSLGRLSCYTSFNLWDFKRLELNGISLTQAVATALGRILMASITHKTLQHLRLYGISLTPVTAALLGQSLPEMSSLQELELTGVHGSILQAEQMEALFGGFNRMMPLCKLTFSGFSVRGCLAPLTKSFHFFPNLRELNLEKLSMDENDQCGLLESLRFIRNVTALEIHSRPLGDADCCTAELNTDDIFRPTAYKSLTLKGIILTPAATVALGQSLPEMLSLQALEVTGSRHKSILQAEEIEALFGRFNGILPLHSLIFRDFSVTGSIAPLTKSFCFFPNLVELNLAQFDMDEHNLCGLLENLRCIPNLMELRVEGKPLDHVDCCTVRVPTVGGFPLKTLKELTLYEISLTPAVATALGRLLPEMLSLQNLRLLGFPENILNAEEMAALFGGFKKTLPLVALTLSGFSVRRCLGPLTESFRFFPNLEQLHLGGFNGKFNMDEHNLCALLQSLRFIPNLKELSVKGQALGDAHFCTVEVNTMASITHKTLKQLELDGVSLTPVTAALLGRSLPEMSSLQVLELTGVDGSILQAEEMEALFGGFNKSLPLRELTFSGFCVRSCLSPLIECLRFFPNLRELKLKKLDIDEQVQCGLLKSFGFIRNVTELIVRVGGEECLDFFHYHTSELNAFDSLTHKRLMLDGLSLTPAVAAVLGRLLPEMSSLQELSLTGISGSILEAEVMEALFGGFNKMLPVYKLTLSSFRGCLAPLYRNLHFFPSLSVLNLEDLNMDEHDSCFLNGLCCAAEVNVRVCPAEVTYKNLEQLKLDRMSLTPAAAVALGQTLPEMSSLQVLELTRMDDNILQPEEMEALFGGFNKPVPLCQLTLSGFSVRGRLAPLFKSLRFFPNLRDLHLVNLNMDEHDLRGLLEGFQFIPNLQELNLSGNPLGHAVTYIVPHVVNMKNLWCLRIENTGHSEEDQNYVRDSVKQGILVYQSVGPQLIF